MKNFTTLAIAILFSWFAANAQNYPINGLISHWNFDSNYSAYNFMASSAGVNGVLTQSVPNPGLSREIGHTGAGFTAVGVADGNKVTLNTVTYPGIIGTPANSNPISVSCWVNVASTTNGYPIFTKLGNNANTYNAIALGYILTAGSVYAEVGVGNSRYSVSYTIPTATYLNNWHHLVMTYDNTTLKLYVDNVERGSRVIGGDINYSQYNGNAEIMNSFTGKFDDLFYYNRALTASEVDKLYNGCNSTITAQITGTNSACLGDAINLDVTATGTNLNYQWKRGTTNVGTNSSTLNIPSATSNDLNVNYTCQVTDVDGCGITTNNYNVAGAAAISTGGIGGGYTNCLGASSYIDIGMNAVGSGTITYEWKKDGVIIPNATASQFTKTNLVSTDAGVYSCTASNGIECSATASMTIAFIPPPTVTITSRGGVLTANATAGNGNTLYYSWSFNGTPIAGAISNTYTPTLGIGVYSVQVIEAFGCSTVADFNYQGNPLKTYCYKFDDGTPNNSCGTTNNGTYIGPWAGLGNDRFGNVNTAYYCGASASGGVECGDIDILNQAEDFTIAGWAQLITSSNPNTNRYIFSKGPFAIYLPTSSNAMVLSVNGTTYNVNTGFGPAGNLFSPANNTTTNGYAFFAFKYLVAGNYAVIQFFINGVVYANFNHFTSNPLTNAGSNFVIGYNTDMKADDIFIINRALTDTQMDSLRNLPNTNCAAPTITSQISGNSATLCEGSTLTLTCAASGSNLSYQWKHNGANVGTNLNTFSVVSTPAATGAYTCVVTNSCGTATTDPFNFTAYTSPAITSQINGSPNNICEGTNVTLNIGATGSNLTYQWKRNGINIGTNSSSLNIPNATTANTANYTCVVTGTCDVATSNSFTLNVLPNPTATISQNAGVLTAVSNATNASYEWFLNGISIPGATNATYTPTANGVYRVAVTDLNSSASCNTLSQGFSVNLTGIYNTLATKTLVIAPNPASDYININIVLEASSDLTFELSDINAKIVYHEILSNVTEINKNISLENLNKGLYFLRIKDNNGILTSKVIKR